METNDKKLYLVNGLSPAFPVHPGSVLGEELEARGIKRKDFAKQIGIQATHLSAIIHGSRSITPAVAAKLEAGLPEITADFWLRFQDKYRVDFHNKIVRSMPLVSGYNQAYDVPEVVLAEPEIWASYNGSIQVTISIPESDKELLESLIKRLGWSVK